MKESYRIDEIATAWQKSYWSILRMIKRGDLKAFKAGATWRITALEKRRFEEKLATLSNVSA